MCIRDRYKESPYFVAVGVNPIIFNTTRTGLDKKEVRKAIAMGTDTAAINEIAVSNYSGDVTQGLILSLIHI